MRHRQAGKVCDGLWYLGREESGVYYLKGRSGAVLISGGLAHILPDVLDQMKSFGLDPGFLTSIVILHSHFDHVGVVPYFKRTWPAVEICASAPAWSILSMPKAVGVANTFSLMAAKMAKAEGGLAGYDYEWRDDVRGTTLKQGDRIDVGGFSLEIHETPGHSSCSITAYEPGLKALFASDAVGIPYRDILFPSANSSMAQYLESLEKLRPLPLAIVGADHYGYVTGEEAAGFIDASAVEARKLDAEMREILRSRGGDVEAAAKAMNALFFERCSDYFIAPEILEGVFKQMMKHIAKSA
ncbi:MAG: MBL fold metallo-hydrolase [Syntrophaceae bacterium]|nr:MBL fold metallo-hydrolase [Syntrophaceae bacterium]